MNPQSRRALNVRQIGSTPKRSRYVSMYRIISVPSGRAVPRKKPMPSARSRSYDAARHSRAVVSSTPQTRQDSCSAPGLPAYSTDAVSPPRCRDSSLPLPPLSSQTCDSHGNQPTTPTPDTFNCDEHLLDIIPSFLIKGKSGTKPDPLQLLTL